MKKSRIIAASMASIALTGTLGSCGFSPDENAEPDVYGPPSSYEDTAEASGSGEYDPIVNIEPAVYGPPEMYGP